MLKKTISTRLTVAFAALGAAAALGACGDNIHGNVPIDGPPADSAGPPDGTPIDAMPTATVSGTVAITDVTLTDPAAVASGFQGGSISITFSDLTAGGGQVLAGTTNIDGCLVKEYSPAHPPNPPLDAGPLLFANATGTGLNRTVGRCGFVSAIGQYLCVSNNDTAATVSAIGNNGTAPGTVALTFSTAAFTGENVQGSYIRINGFTNGHYNSGASAFPIVAQVAPTTLLIADPAGTTDALEAAATPISYTVINGFAPVPGGSDFLNDGSIVVHKCVAGDPAPFDCTTANTDVWPTINQTLNVPAQGWSLSDPGVPNAFPYTGTAADIKFGCGNNTTTSTDDTCGTAATNFLSGTIIAGVASTKSLATGCGGGQCLPFQMPDEIPGTDTWVEFQCAFLGGAATAKLDAAAITAIRSITPSRVELRVIHAGGNILASGPSNINSLNLLVGHAFVGHTDPP